MSASPPDRHYGSQLVVVSDAPPGGSSQFESVLLRWRRILADAHRREMDADPSPRAHRLEAARIVGRLWPTAEAAEEGDDTSDDTSG